MDIKTSFLFLIGYLASHVLAVEPTSTLPVLYRVDQPTSNVVVFRGANVALARAAGLVKTPVFDTRIGGDINGEAFDDGKLAPSFVASPLSQPALPLPLPPSVEPSPPPPIITASAPLVIPPASVIFREPALSYRPLPVTYVEPEPLGPANYNWEYAVLDDRYNDFGHKETRDGFLATGKYYVNLPDGRRQVVTYTADANGYVPVVEYSGVAQFPEIFKPGFN